MIPRVIHYIWLSDEPVNKSAQMCIATWPRKAKGFTIKRWSMKDFDFSTMPLWVNQALALKKWAFVCDYLRLYVLEKEGGFYLDSDVVMLRSPEEFLGCRFVSAVEYFPDLYERSGQYQVDAEGNSSTGDVIGMAIQAAVMGSEPHHPFLKRCMAFYETHAFVREDGSLYDNVVAPMIYANAAAEIGFKYRNERQELADGVTLLESEVFAPFCSLGAKNSAMIHLVTGSWQNLTDEMRRHVQKRNTYYLENALMRSGDIPTIVRIVPKRAVQKLRRGVKKVLKLLCGK